MTILSCFIKSLFMHVATYTVDLPWNKKVGMPFFLSLKIGCMWMKNVHTIINCTNASRIGNSVGYLDLETHKENNICWRWFPALMHISHQCNELWHDDLNYKYHLRPKKKLGFFVYIFCLKFHTHIWQTWWLLSCVDSCVIRCAQ